MNKRRKKREEIFSYEALNSLQQRNFTDKSLRFSCVIHKNKEIGICKIIKLSDNFFENLKRCTSTMEFVASNNVLSNYKNYFYI